MAQGGRWGAVLRQPVPPAALPTSTPSLIKGGVGSRYHDQQLDLRPLCSSARACSKWTLCLVMEQNRRDALSFGAAGGELPRPRHASALRAWRSGGCWSGLRLQTDGSAVLGQAGGPFRPAACAWR